MSEIDPDKLKEKSSSRRTSVSAKSESLWQCAYCKATLPNEAKFMKHECKEMLRHGHLKTVDGQAAYQFYCDWMKLNKRKAPNIDSFATSRYYTSFVKFVEHKKKISLHAPDTFLRLMVERDISPTLWVRPQCYSIYLEYYDNMHNPMSQVADTIEFLVRRSEKDGVPLDKLFAHLGVHEITELIVLRKLSPWLLFCSSTFGDFLRTLTPGDWTILQDVINPTYWAEKLENNSEMVAEIIDYSNSVGL